MRVPEGAERLDLAELTADEYEARMTDAIDLASDQDKMVWLTGGGADTVLAVIVPPDVAEYHEKMMADVLATEFAPGEPVRYPDVRVKRSVLRDGDTSVLLNVVLGAMRGRAVGLADLREFRQAVFDVGSYARALRLAEQTVTFE